MSEYDDDMSCNRCQTISWMIKTNERLKNLQEHPETAALTSHYIYIIIFSKLTCDIL